METIRIKLKDIAPNKGQIPGLPANPRQWSRTEIDKIAKSLKETPELFEARPIIVMQYAGKFVILGGNLRYEGCKANKDVDAPCFVVPDDTPVEKLKEIIIKDNGSFGQWDYDALANEWDDLPLVDWGVPAWETEEKPETPEAKDDEFDEDTDNIPVRCNPGDIWQLGEHRLMCGDSTDYDSVDKLFCGEKARMLFTSPPYSDMREYNGGKDLSVSNLVNFIPAYARHTDYQCINLGLQRKNADIFEYWNDYISTARGCGYKMLAWNVWDKMTVGAIGNQKAFFPIRHEWIFVFGTEYYEINRTWEKKEENITNEARTMTVRQADGHTRRANKGDMSNPFKPMESVLQLLPTLQQDIRELHPATFPVGLPAEYIKAMSNPGDIIAEPFGGSGTTLIASEQLGRRCFAMELDSHYCDVILARWEQLTGKTAQRITECGKVS